MASSKINGDQKYTYFNKIVYWTNSLFSADENMYFSEKSTAGDYTKEGENICPPSKIIYNKYLLILLGQNVFDIEASCNKYL